ncbi:translocase [Actibacterium sp. MT2.3-13A]|uniref:translocase n=1 Tax=Actibacterium sp. MT2.3-13A TaxID=2828332 RepID=UPI001BABC37C|nr:translocase [Actibacterium sp. MT2.3-13A]
MALKRRLLAAGATLVAAAVIGQFVHPDGALLAMMKPRPAAPRPAAASTAVLEPVAVVPLAAQPDRSVAGPATASSLPALPRDRAGQPGPAPVEADLPRRVAALDEGYAAPRTDAQKFNQYGLSCETTLRAEPAPGGMVTLHLDAPCQPGARVAVYHDALRFAARSDSAGMLSVALPALREQAAFLVSLPDGSTASAVARVPEAADYAHAALQWQGRAGMEIHAYEAGATTGAPGHVWAGAPSTPEAGAGGAGGFLVRLGDADLAQPMLAEVYSYPRGTGPHDGAVRLSIEAEVTPESCGHEVEAETLRPGPEGGLRPAALTLYMPGCEAVGEFLVLKNLLPDMKLARN